MTTASVKICSLRLLLAAAIVIWRSNMVEGRWTLWSVFGWCPPASNALGSCVYDPHINCFYDLQCGFLHRCCPEACNYVCKYAYQL
ncbi:WAP-type 'four-disulfide core' domain [Trinorchestia longiramus]|nr:WAP-type 'four-disulfide core' domain [Trinorchestia longiramus]